MAHGEGVMMLSTLVLAALLLQTTTSEKIAHVAIAGHVVANFADVSSTEWALGKGAFREANPLLKWASKDPIPMAIAKGSYAAGTAYLLLRLHKSHPKLAILAAVTSAGLTGYVAHRNAQLARGVK